MKSTKEFLSDLYRGCEDGCITITTLDATSKAPCNYHFPVTEIDKAAGLIQAMGHKCHTYYNMALRVPGLDPRNRGNAGQIRSVVCMYADIDVKGPAHKQQALPESREEVLSFLDELAMTPSYIIDSGNGIHAIWLLEEPYHISDTECRKYIEAVSAGFGAYIIREGQKRGWILDNVQDITRMLRAPGTLNFKTEPAKECRIIHCTDIRYPLASFAPFCAPEKQHDRSEEDGGRGRQNANNAGSDYTAMPADAGSIGSAERMCGHCAFVDHCIREAESLSEPWWHAFLSIVALTEDGDEKCHEWSRPYGGYDQDETEERVRRAVKEQKPCSCDFIHKALGFHCPEAGCRRGEYVVRGPIAFSFYTKIEQVERLLSLDLTFDEALEEKNLLLASFAKTHEPALYIRIKKKYQKLGIGVRDLERSVSDMAMRAARRDANEHDTGSGNALMEDDSPASLDLTGIDTTGLKMPDKWILNMDGLSRLVMTEMGEVPVRITSTPLLITKRIEDLDDGSEKLEISFYTKHRWKRVTLPRGDAMDKGKIVKYASSGLPVHTGNHQKIIAFLVDFEETNADSIAFHRSIDHLGWVGGLKEFYPFHMKDEVVFEGETAEASKLVKAITKAGDEAAWMDMAVRLRTMPYARAVLAASFASVLLKPLRHRNLYLHIWKDSRSGKTAAQKAAASVWGDPARLMINYNSTQVGFERSAAAMNHMPLILDELQSCSMKPDQFSRLVYMIANGDGRTRGDKYGGTQEQLHWNNVILSSGEQPIIVGNSMDGIVTRVMDIAGIPIPDEEFAALVHRTCAANYGFAGERFVNWLYERYLTAYAADTDGKRGGQDEEDSAIHKVTADGMRSDYMRFSELLGIMYDLYEGRDAGFHLENVAVIAFADYLASMALFGADKETAESDAINLGIELLANIHSREKADSIDRAWDYICDWANSNKMHFEVKRRLGTGYDRAAVSPVYGRYFPQDKAVRFIPSCFYDALQEGGFSVEKCYTGFKERGYIDRSQRQTRIDGNREKAIVARIELGLKPFDADDGEDNRGVFE